MGQKWDYSEQAHPLHGLALAEERWRYVLQPNMVQALYKVLSHLK
jgi:hypothetical protein